MAPQLYQLVSSFFGAVFTKCRMRLYLRKEDVMRNTLLCMLACTSLPLIHGTGRAAEPQVEAALITSVRGCAQNEAAACKVLAQRLAVRLKGLADGSLELRLGMAGASAIEDPGRLVAGVAESCRVGYTQACLSLARVLDKLFTGDDARLERSTDRLLAHEIAERVMAVVGDSTLSAQRVFSRVRALR